MKKRIRVACWFGASAALAAFAACSGTTEPTAAPDAAAAPAPTPAPAPPPTGSTPPTTPPADAGDSAPPRDATTDATALDAADGALGVDAMDAADGYDGAPLPGSAATVADIPGLTDFDFVGDHLVYRVPAVKHCTLPSCADETTIPAADLATVYPAGWAVGDDERVHFVTLNLVSTPSTFRIDSRSVRLDGAALTSQALAEASYCTLRCVGQPILAVRGFHVGSIGVVMWRTGGENFNTASRYWTDSHAGSGVNTGRVGRATGLYHSNAGGSSAHYTEQKPDPATRGVASFAGVSAPVPATPPTLVAISAAGATVPHPTVVVLRDGNVEACPLATPCLAWLNLGALGTILNLDDQHLYIGTPTGLSRCALAEIGTAGTCTLVPHGPVEAVEEPLYLTTTHAWYRSGTQVRRVLK